MNQHINQYNNLITTNNLIWEEKGIILGIIFYILKHVKKLLRVYIEDKFFYRLIKDLFPILDVQNRYEDEPGKYGVNICVKTTQYNHGDLILNNINNIDDLRTKRKNLFLLPWFNRNNPIIMFKYDERKNKGDINQLKRRIKKFHKVRLENIVVGNYVLPSYNCQYLFWDMFLEYYILKKYSIFFNIDVDIIANYLYHKVNSFNCKKIIETSRFVPIYIKPKIDIDAQHKKIQPQQMKNAINQIMQQPAQPQL